MPELPDVETWKRYVDATSLHQKVSDVHVDAPRMLKGIAPDKLVAALKGSTFETTTRHGKFLFVGLGKGSWLLLHFGMTGYLKYVKGGDEALPGARLVVHFTGSSRLAGFWPRRLGRIGLVEDPASFAAEEGLGIDALDPKLDLAAFRDMLARKRGTIKSALMDQGFIAGIGNVYSDEILYQAGLDPQAPARDLDERQTEALHRSMLHVLELAIERQADPERLPDSWILPRRHEGERCPRCGGTIEKVKFSGRTAYVCRACQGRTG